MYVQLTRIKRIINHNLLEDDEPDNNSLDIVQKRNDILRIAEIEIVITIMKSTYLPIESLQKLIANYNLNYSGKEIDFRLWHLSHQ